MILLPVEAFALLLLAIGVSTVAGLWTSALLPWDDAARRAGLTRAVGVGIGPFLFGIGGVLALALAPGAANGVHLAFGFAFPAAVGIIARIIGGRRAPAVPVARQPLDFGEKALAMGLALAVIFLFGIVIFVPLTQNDALEYALAARELFAARDLAAYPVFNPATNVTGFFGPWTHPPLYVSLVYLTNVVQGHADTPEAMRVISPWFMLVGARVVYALALYVDRRTALASALVFMAPPLFFLGSASALIDALPVLGFALIVASVVGIRAPPILSGAVTGLLLGLALWTHSQAILFLALAPAGLAIRAGLKGWRALALESVAMIGVALAVGGWPYWRNVEIFGSPVSDNPAVFALTALRWNEYFAIGRGLDNPVAMLQYGVLKGWFAFESYSLVFWGMTVGAVFFLAAQRLSVLPGLILGGARSFAPREMALWTLLSLMLVYLGGVVVSVALGIEHMVKNERYLLVTSPMVAVLCAYGYMRLVDTIGAHRSWSTRSRQLAQALLAAVLVAKLGLLTAYAGVTHNIHRTGFLATHDEKIFNMEQYRPLASLRAGGDESALILSMRPADMFYMPNRMLSYLDERLLPFYAQTNPEAAHATLRELGVKYIHIPDYGLPPLYNSQLHSIVADRAKATLLHAARESQIYLLADAGLRPRGAYELTYPAQPWTRGSYFLLGGRKGFAAISTGQEDYAGGPSIGEGVFRAFHRNTISTLSVGAQNESAPYERALFDRTEELEYRFSFRARGSGLVRVVLDETYKEEDDELRTRVTRLVTFELSDDQPVRDYALRFLVSDAVVNFSITFEHVGLSQLEIERAVVETYERP
ncbi:MAG: hypothetical protein MEP57_04330 [Microvirga sp.]|nr:hypothetical protein [Microvirga sp.]